MVNALETLRAYVSKPDQNPTETDVRNVRKFNNYQSVLKDLPDRPTGVASPVKILAITFR
jgi:hypothetical protein